MIDCHIPLYKGALVEMSNDQQLLIYWCRFYNQYVFSVEEKNRPSNFTVDYDVLMDNWVERKHFKEEIKAKTGKSAEDMDFVISFDD